MKLVVCTGVAVNLDPAVADCVLPAAGRNNPPHFVGGAPTRKICALHHDTRHVQVSKMGERVAGEGKEADLSSVHFTASA